MIFTVDLENHCLAAEQVSILTSCFGDRNFVQPPYARIIIGLTYKPYDTTNKIPYHKCEAVML